MKLYKTLISLFLIFFLVRCENKIPEIILNKKPNSVKLKGFKTITFDVDAYNRNVSSTNIDNIGGAYKLGQTTDNVFGTTKLIIASQISHTSYPIRFGNYIQSEESNAIDEEEKVKEVHLYIPFFSNKKVDETGKDMKYGDKNLYALDSVFGNKDASFRFKVERLNYYFDGLNGEDFTKRKLYYSDFNLSPYKTDVLADIDGKIDDSEIIIYKKDDPEQVDTRIEPRIDITLDKAYFQTHILDKEGSDELRSILDFNNYFRGISISLEQLSEDLLMLLDISKASIYITYTYKSVDKKNTENTSDDVIESKEDIAKFNLSGKILNVYQESKSIAEDVDTAKNPETLYLKGGANGYFIEIELFKDNYDEFISKIDVENELINEANIIFNVNKTVVNSSNFKYKPIRLYVFDIDDKSRPLSDYLLYNPPRQTDKFPNKNAFKQTGGILVEENDKSYYKIRITDFVNNIIKAKNKNRKLGICITSNILDRSLLLANVIGKEKDFRLPRAMVYHHGATALYGNSKTKTAEDKKIKLEIILTK